MEKTLELIQHSYTWPGMPALVKDYASSVTAVHNSKDLTKLRLES